MRGALKEGGILSSLFGNLVHDIDEGIDGFLALGLRGLNHEGLVEQEREVDGRCVEAVVQEALGYIQGGGTVDVVVGAVIDEAVKDELMLAYALDGELVSILQALLDIVCAKYRILTYFLDVFLANGKDIGIGAEDDSEVAVETGHLDLGETLGHFFGHAHGAAAGTATAVRRGEGLVQVQVHDVKAHVSGTHNTQHGVHVGAVVVQKAATAVHQGCNLQNLGLEQAQGVGVGHHDTGYFVVQKRFEGFYVNAAVLQGLHFHYLEAADGSRCRVGAMGAVRNNDLGAFEVSPHHVIGTHEHKARELTMGAGAGLKSESMHSGNLCKCRIHSFIHFAGAFRCTGGHQGMQAGKTGQGAHLFIDLGIVLHGAGTQRIEAGIYTKVHLGEVVVVADHLRLAYLGKAGS